MIQVIWGFIKEHFRGFRRLILGVLSITFLQSVLIVPTPLLIRNVFDVAIPEKDIQAVISDLALVAVLFLVNMLLIILERFVTLKISKQIISSIRINLLSRLLAFSKKNYNQKNGPELHTALIQDTERIDVMLNALVGILLPSLVVSSALLGTLFYLNWTLTIVLVATLPLLIIAVKRSQRKMNTYISRFHSSFRKFREGILFIINKYDLILIKSAQPIVFRKENENIKSLQRDSRQMALFVSFNKQFMEYMVLLISLLILAFGSYLVINDSLTLGSLLSFYFVVYVLRRYQTNIIQSIPAVLEGKQSIENILNQMDTPQDQLYKGTKIADFDNLLSLKNVFFSYNSTPLLSGINLELYPGEKVAIVGSNGTGKSTIMSLILGLEYPSSGEIFADDINYTDLNISQFRRHIGVIWQEQSLFNATIKENLIFGLEDVSDQEIQSALNLSTANDFINSADLNLETVIGESGIMLSGGQRQKIALARALIGRPRLIIMDEPTNHLDDQSISRLLGNIAKLDPKPTILLISHNIKVTDFADRVYTLHDGKLKKGSSQLIIK